MTCGAVVARVRGMKVRSVLRRIRPPAKGDAEMEFWQERFDEEGVLTNAHYEPFYTESFGLDRSFYAGKRVLDIGCGPRGSLEWATEAAQRVGLDPLVGRYRSLGIDRHAMEYVESGSETIPFGDGHFDIVTVFNALDHVDDVDASISEISRVTKPGGTCLVIVEVGHKPTPTEPQSLEWDLLEQFEGWTVVTNERAAIDDAHDVYGSWRAKAPWVSGAGLLGARLERV